MENYFTPVPVNEGSYLEVKGRLEMAGEQQKIWSS